MLFYTVIITTVLSVFIIYTYRSYIVWFYTLIITYCFYYLFVLFLYFVISPVTGSSDLLELNNIQQQKNTQMFSYQGVPRGGNTRVLSIGRHVHMFIPD